MEILSQLIIAYISFTISDKIIRTDLQLTETVWDLNLSLLVYNTRRTAQSISIKPSSFIVVSALR